MQQVIPTTYTITSPSLFVPCVNDLIVFRHGHGKLKHACGNTNLHISHDTSEEKNSATSVTAKHTQPQSANRNHNIHHIWGVDTNATSTVSTHKFLSMIKEPDQPVPSKSDNKREHDRKHITLQIQRGGLAWETCASSKMPPRLLRRLHQNIHEKEKKVAIKQLRKEQDKKPGQKISRRQQRRRHVKHKGRTNVTQNHNGIVNKIYHKQSNKKARAPQNNLYESLNIRKAQHNHQENNKYIYTSTAVTAAFAHVQKNGQKDSLNEWTQQQPRENDICSTKVKNPTMETEVATSLPASQNMNTTDPTAIKTTRPIKQNKKNNRAKIGQEPPESQDGDDSASMDDDKKDATSKLHQVRHDHHHFENSRDLIDDSYCMPSSASKGQTTAKSTAMSRRNNALQALKAQLQQQKDGLGSDDIFLDNTFDSDLNEKNQFDDDAAEEETAGWMTPPRLSTAEAEVLKNDNHNYFREQEEEHQQHQQQFQRYHPFEIPFLFHSHIFHHRHHQKQHIQDTGDTANATHTDIQPGSEEFSFVAQILDQNRFQLLHLLHIDHDEVVNESSANITSTTARSIATSENVNLIPFFFAGDSWHDLVGVAEQGFVGLAQNRFGSASHVYSFGSTPMAVWKASDLLQQQDYHDNLQTNKTMRLILAGLSPTTMQLVHCERDSEAEPQSGIRHGVLCKRIRAWLDRGDPGGSAVTIASRNKTQVLKRIIECAKLLF